MNKKTLTVFASTIIGTVAITSFASAEDINLGTSLKNKMGLLKSEEHRDENSVKEKKENSSKTESEKIASLKAHGIKEIDARIAALASFNTRIQALANVTAANKAVVAVNVQTQTAALVALKAKIAAATDLATLKVDVASIKKLHKTFGFMVPKINLLERVEAHFVRINKLASTTLALSADIQTARTGGEDVTSLLAKLAEANVKLANANVQSNAALALIAPLAAHMGSSTILLANKQVFIDAQAKYKLALTDIKDVKAYIKTIVKQLKDWNVAVTAKTDVKSH